MDDGRGGLMFDVCWEKDDVRCLSSTRSLSDYFWSGVGCVEDRDASLDV